jgi:hypothetical protein
LNVIALFTQIDLGHLLVNVGSIVSHALVSLNLHVGL